MVEVIAMRRRPPKTTAIWVYGGTRPPSDDFLGDPRRKCRGNERYYFSDDLMDHEVARRLCSTCPLFQPCTRWILANFPYLPDYMVAGMTSDQRRRIYEGKEPYVDWRKDFNFAERAAKAAGRKRARQGISKRQPEEEP